MESLFDDSALPRTGEPCVLARGICLAGWIPLRSSGLSVASLSGAMDLFRLTGQL